MTRASRSTLLVVFLTVFIDLLGFGIVIPLLPLYAQRYAPTPLQFGLLMSSYSAMQFLTAPVLGRISDRVGRRPVILVSLVGSVAGYLVFAFASSLAVLFVSRILAGMTGGNIGTAQAVIADSTTHEDRARGMGLVGMAFGLGFIFGPAIGGFAVRVGEAVPGLVAAALSATAFLWALFALPETRPTDAPVRPLRLVPLQGFRRAFRRPGVGALLVLSAVATTAFANFEATFAQFLSARFGAGPSAVAWLFVVLGVVSALVQGLFIRRLVARFGEARLLVWGAAVLLLGFVGLAVSASMPLLLLAIVLMALGAGVTNPSLSGLASRLTPPGEQGETLGALQSTSSFGRIIGPFWGENVYLRFGPVGPYGTGAALEVVAAGLAGLAVLSENRSAETEIAP